MTLQEILFELLDICDHINNDCNYLEIKDMIHDLYLKIKNFDFK